MEISKLNNLKNLNLCYNYFAHIPCGLQNLKNLTEFHLEWFAYAVPSLPQTVKCFTESGKLIMHQLFQLLDLLIKYDMNSCALITFLENFSE